MRVDARVPSGATFARFSREFDALHFHTDGDEPCHEQAWDAFALVVAAGPAIGELDVASPGLVEAQGRTATTEPEPKADPRGLELKALGDWGPLGALGVSWHVLHPLKKWGRGGTLAPPTTLSELAAMSRADLLTFPGIGAKRVAEIATALREYGLELATEPRKAVA